jgi:hypothetical protein
MNLLLRIFGAPLIWKLQKLKKERPDNDLNTFMRSFEHEGINERLLREVYHYFQHITSGVDFPVLPTDRLYEVFGLCDEDLDDAILEIAERSGCQTPTTEEVKGLPPVRTVEDVVRLLSRFT